MLLFYTRDQPVVTFWSVATNLWSPSDLMRPAYGHLLIWRLTLKQGLSTTDDFPESPPLMWCSLFLGICPVVTASEDAASVHGKREYCRMTIKKYPGHSAHRAEVEGLIQRLKQILVQVLEQTPTAVLLFLVISYLKCCFIREAGVNILNTSFFIDHREKHKKNFPPLVL